MPPKSILKKTSKPIPGTRTASGKRVRPGQNLRKAAAAEKESEKAKGKHDKKKLIKGGKYEKYLGPGEYNGPTGGNAGPLGVPGSASASAKDAAGKGKGKGKGKDVGGKKNGPGAGAGAGKKTVTLAVRKSGNDDDGDEDGDGDVDMSGDDFGDDDGSEGSGGEGTDEELGKKGSKSSGNSKFDFFAHACLVTAFFLH